MVDAAAAGRFHLYAVDTVDEALELLTGMPVGTPEVDGSLSQRVAARLKHLAELRRAFARKSGTEKSGRGSDNSHDDNA